MGTPKAEETEEGTEEIYEIMTGFPQINAKHQATYPGSSENTKQDKCQKKPPKNLKPKTKKRPPKNRKTTPQHTVFKLKKIKDKEKS